MIEINCNINHNVEVILTKEGADIINKYFDDFRKKVEGYTGTKPPQNMIYKEGDVYSTELWYLMMIFGPHMYGGADPYFKNNNITIKDILLLTH